jgi:hypothetical protein
MPPAGPSTWRSALGFVLLLVCADSAHKAHLGGANKLYGQSTTASG